MDESCVHTSHGNGCVNVNSQGELGAGQPGPRGPPGPPGPPGPGSGARPVGLAFLTASRRIVNQTCFYLALLSWTDVRGHGGLRVPRLGQIPGRCFK